ncbi:MAG: hypothetical protein EA422_08845 [Gemmatimonadales bacterium]|nr:MAG: hypothetical protein EA422_08845 [Gemmatimonadales bacterium]
MGSGAEDGRGLLHLRPGRCLMDLDPRMTFDSFVVGPANRMAAAAAKRAAESPGKGYNPLFLYSDSGLGKSHILNAIAHHSDRYHPGGTVLYQPLELYLSELTDAMANGSEARLGARYQSLDLLLLDDVQFLEGQPEAQEMLLRLLDRITARGGQTVLASDRSPAEIDGLDSRLLNRFSGGLIVDIGPPDLETRTAILRRKAEERGAGLAEGVLASLAKAPFRNVRELQGALNRILVLQELEGRPISVEELPALIQGLPGVRVQVAEGRAPSRQPPAVPAWRRRLEAAAEAAEAEGIVATRLRRLLEHPREPSGWESALTDFETALDRIRQIRRELESLGNPWPEAAATLLRNPDRLDESEALLASARERARGFAPLPDGPGLERLGEDMPRLAVRAADRLLQAESPDYNPLFLHTPSQDRGRSFLAAVGRTHRSRNPEARIAFVSAAEFAEEFIDALARGVAGAWRERWWTVEVLLLYGIQELSMMERAQDEFFHLFEALKRRNSRIFLAADRLPSAFERVDNRLLSRFEGGLVVDLGEEARSRPEEAAESPRDTAPPRAASASAPLGRPGGGTPRPGGSASEEELELLRQLATVGAPDRGGDGDSGAPVGLRGSGEELEGVWRPSRERVVWDWPAVEEQIVEDYSDRGQAEWASKGR